MSSRQRNLIRLAAVATLAMACSVHAQKQDGQGAAAAAINEAVQQGTTPYRPDPAATPGSIESAECRELAAQIATAPKREYRTTDSTIETAQGRQIPELERERPRKSLQQAYQEKCTQ
ncbi:hypothetical protein [Cupriavidus sp. Agwp_2]|uniref:hypothetical protein n=1 Tax=Cupriavidus sp. Agwp_2 TaxID=2897324 RepID=UPI0034602307